MAKKYFPTLRLRRDNYEIMEHEARERRIIEGKILIDYSCFQKSKKEREILKLAKLQCKIDELKG